MGIQDRDYYRDDDGGFLANWARYGQVVKTLIALNIVVFVIQLVGMKPGHPSSGWVSDHLVLIGDRILAGEVWRLLTYGFLHSTDNLLHIIFNLLFLYWFGRELEERYGPREFLAFYLVSIVLAGLLYLGAAKLGLNGSSMLTRVLGASGGVTAVMVLFAFHFPMRRVMLFGVIPMPVWLLVVLFIGIDLWGLLLSDHDVNDGERVAFAAHIGGAAFAAVYYLRQWRLTALMPRWPIRAARSRPRPSLSMFDDDSPRPAPAPREPVPAEEPEQPLDTQVDAVLAKVAQQGQGSLTTAERAILQRASEVYRRRRK